MRQTLTLDPEVVQAFGGDARALSAVVNDVLHAEVARRKRRQALREWIDELEVAHGPVDAAEAERPGSSFVNILILHAEALSGVTCGKAPRVSAFLVAAVEQGWDVMVLADDPDHLRRLLAGVPHVHVEAI